MIMSGLSMSDIHLGDSLFFSRKTQIINVLLRINLNMQNQILGYFFSHGTAY